MLPDLNSLERLRDHGLFVFRVTVGGTALFYSLAELSAGVAAWRGVGGLVRLFGIGLGVQYAGLAVLLGGLGCGAMLVLGLWTRWAALLSGAAVLAVAGSCWPEVRSGTLQGAASFFYPLTVAAGLGALATTGGGRFGIDGVYRARRKAHARRNRGR